MRARLRVELFTIKCKRTLIIAITISLCFEGEFLANGFLHLLLNLLLNIYHKSTNSKPFSEYSALNKFFEVSLRETLLINKNFKMINQLELTIIENRNVDKAQHLFEI
jgi:hypothetical protein